MTQHWYYQHGKTRQGPVDSKVLKQLAANGTIQPTTLLQQVGTEAAVRAGSLKGLFPKAVQPPPLPPLPKESQEFAIGSEGQLPVWRSWPIVVLSMTCCFPVGLLLVWTHPRWTTAMKSIWTGGLVLVLAVLGMVQARVDPDSGLDSNSATAGNSSISDDGSDLVVVGDYDYSQDNFDDLPAGAKKITKEFKSTDGWVVSEGIELPDGSTVKHGDHTEWSEKSKQNKLFSVRFLNGEEHGPMRFWHPNGQLKSETLYVNKNLHGLTRSWFDDGSLDSEVGWRNDRKNGVSRHWYGKGQLKDECNYKDDVRDGEFRRWTSDGTLTHEGIFRDGKAVGEWRIYCSTPTDSVVCAVPADQWHGGKALDFLARIEVLLAERDSHHHSGVFINSYAFALPETAFLLVFGEPDRKAMVSDGQGKWFYACDDDTVVLDVGRNPTTGSLSGRVVGFQQ